MSLCIPWVPGTTMNQSRHVVTYRLNKFAEVKKFNSKQLLGKCAKEQIKGWQTETKK
jgi:hypothetical protein